MFHRVADGELLIKYDKETIGGVNSIQFSRDGSVFAYGTGTVGWTDDIVIMARNPFAPQCEPCDADCDGAVNAFDIEPFIDVVFNGVPPCGLCAGDVNGDGRRDAFDIEPFIDCLFGP
jgi:hypothetical protein